MKQEHKEIYLEKVVIPSFVDEGFGTSFSFDKGLVDLAYLTIPEIKRYFKRRRK